MNKLLDRLLKLAVIIIIIYSLFFQNHFYSIPQADSGLQPKSNNSHPTLCNILFC